MKKIKDIKKKPPVLWVTIGLFATLIIILLILLSTKGVNSNVQSTIIGCLAVLFFTIRDKVVHRNLELPQVFWIVPSICIAAMIVSSIVFNLGLINLTIQTIILLISILVSCAFQGFLIERRD